MANLKKDALSSMRQNQIENENRRLNIILRTQEKLAGIWNVRELKDVNYNPKLAPTESERTGRTPRARVIAYNSQDNTLIVVFWDNTWWQYNNVPVDMWMALSSSSSTGGYLHTSGLNVWGDMGEAVIDNIPTSVRAQIAQIAMSATRIRAKLPGA